ncbi:DUF2851 family protein [Pelobium manganitolerans]|uniref:DUF2851 family protein n=1 Tax=Pelobium manganitolerans TaxID=1842495 RepID=UPI003FA3C7AB
MPSSEAILHHIWKYKLFNALALHTTDGEPVQLLNAGRHNLDAGPDFFNAKLKIGDTVWAGNVEIHIKSSDWLKHKHQHDAAYNNVVLHVVWEHDAPIHRIDGTLLPVLDLSEFTNTTLLDKYEQLRGNNYWVACENHLPSVSDVKKALVLDRMLAERLEDKSLALKEIYSFSAQSWDDTFYIALAKSFGFKVNALPFELLAKNLPQRILAKHKDQALQVEALIFGVAGLLNQNFTDAYPKLLQQEFRFLRAKYNLPELEASIWKFSKTRPDNFPTIRLAQFAALVLQSQHLFSQMIGLKTKKEFASLFARLPVNSYWNKHYRFDKEAEEKPSAIGFGSVDNLLINAIAPLLFFYGKSTGQKKYTEVAGDLLLAIKPEDNQIVRGFKARGFGAAHAFDTQALIHLKKNYCDLKKCLNCGVGLEIIKQND